MQQTLVLQMQLKAVNDRLLTVVADAAALENDPDRPPSPPPKYDSRGVRTNTREVRMREELTKERVQHIEELLRINPMYQVTLMTMILLLMMLIRLISVIVELFVVNGMM